MASRRACRRGPSRSRPLVRLHRPLPCLCHATHSYAYACTSVLVVIYLPSVQFSTSCIGCHFVSSISVFKVQCVTAVTSCTWPWVVPMCLGSSTDGPLTRAGGRPVPWRRSGEQIRGTLGGNGACGAQARFGRSHEQKKGKNLSRDLFHVVQANLEHAHGAGVWNLGQDGRQTSTRASLARNRAPWEKSPTVRSAISNQKSGAPTHTPALGPRGD